jgi:uncharacterized protein YaiI (UPF0178 family)
MREFTAELEGFAARTGEEVTVVFDGRPFELEGDRVEVRFATRRGRNAADDDIARLAREHPDGLTVVSSDGELVRRAEEAGALTMGSGAFRKLVGDSR